MEELVRLVGIKAGISNTQAAVAVAVTIEFLAGRLPSPMVGRIRTLVSETASEGSADDATKS